MARFNEILVGRFNRALSKLTAIKGPVPSPQLSSEIMPVLNMFRGAEDRAMESWYRYSAFASIAAVAAQNAILQIRNPSGSNVIAVVEKITAHGTAAGAIDISQANPAADLANAVTTIPLDNRQGLSGNASTLKASTGTNAGPPVGTNIISQGAPNAAGGSVDFILYENGELVLPPGAGLLLIDNTVNDVFVASFWWRERFLEDSERTA